MLSNDRLLDDVARRDLVAERDRHHAALSAIHAGEAETFLREFEGHAGRVDQIMRELRGRG